jgi:hypothetical protein
MIQKKNVELLLISTFLLCFLGLLLINTIHAPFYIDDEYNLIKVNKPNELFGHTNNLFQDFLNFQKGFFDFGRFFPLLSTIVFLRGKIAGTSPLDQHIIVFLFGVASAVVVYLIGKRLNFSRTVSFICSITLLTGHEFGEIYMRLQSGESPALLFILICIYFIVKFQETEKKTDLYISFVFGIFAGLCKESFIIVLPLLPFIGVLKYNSNELIARIKEQKQSFYLFFSAFAILTFLLLVVIKTSNKVFDYGEALSFPDLLLNNFIWIFKWFVPFMPIVLFVLVDVVKQKKFNLILMLCLFSAAWISSQLLIYYKIIISFSQGRYLIPSALIFIFLLGLSLNYIENKHKKFYYIALILVSLITIRNAKIIHINSNEFAARANAYKSLIDEMLINKPQKIAVYGGYEFFQSISTFFKWHNYQPELITTPVVASLNKKKKQYENSAFENSLQEKLNAQYELKTINELGADSTVNFLITASYEEWEELNYKEISKSFPHHKKITSNFANASFGDLLKKDFWLGSLKNDQRTLVVFFK